VRLLVVRHAPAGDRAAWSAAGRDDFLRPLTKEGRRKMREAARGLARLVPSPDALATSPLARALETADVLAKAFNVSGAEELDALRPGRAPEDLLPWLRDRARAAAGLAAVVGHEPHLGELVSWLLSGPGRPFLAFRKGGACLLDLGGRPRPGGAELLWLLAPAQLRRVGR
jgi:phosphohistidine phosphatase